VNLTAPEPVTNREVTAAMGRVLHRPTLAAVPAPVLRAVVGEFAGDVLGSQRVRPKRLLESGFTFRHPGIEAAIRAAVDDRA
jgi:NAD dependent epimerase/dehydratase family enzyme